MIDADRRYYGLYEGLVVDANDPEDSGRIQVKVPQLFGNNITDWVRCSSGNIGQSKFPYGTYITTTTQSIPANAATVVNNWVAEDTSKSYLDGNRIYVEETGDYFFQFSAVFAKTNASAGQADIWIRKNGTDIDNSNTTIHLSGSNAEVAVTVGFILDLDAGDYIQLVASASSSNTQLVYHSIASNPTRPAVPGVIATINLVGKWKPQPGTIVWIMFIAGDPNFPVWIGAE